MTGHLGLPTKLFWAVSFGLGASLCTTSAVAQVTSASALVHQAVDA